MNLQKLRNATILVLLAAVIATLCDKVHVLTKTIVYPPPTIDGQGWWVFPGFVIAFSIMVITYLMLNRYLPENIKRYYSTTPGTPSALVESFLLFVLVYVLSGFASTSPLFLNGFFYVTFLFRLAVTRDRAFIFIFSCLLAVGGCLVEGVLSMNGLIQYSRADFFYVPAWLPGLYLHGSFALREGARIFIFRKNDEI